MEIRDEYRTIVEHFDEKTGEEIPQEELKKYYLIKKIKGNVRKTKNLS